MASTDARPQPLKNVAYRLYFAIRDNQGLLVTTWAGQDTELSGDGGAFADATSEAVEIGTSGCGYVDFTAGEMNYDAVMVKITVTNTDALPVVITLYPQEAADRVPLVEQTADQVWDEVAAGHVTGGTFGALLNAAGGGADPATIAAAVWDELLAGHLGAGSTGEALNAAGAAGDPWTTTLPGAYGAGSAGYILGTNLDATITSRASAANLAIVDDIVDAILVLATAIDAKTTLIPSTIDGYTLQQWCEIVGAVLAGKVSNVENGAPIFRSLDDTANRMAALVDTNNNRTAVTLTPST